MTIELIYMIEVALLAAWLIWIEFTELRPLRKELNGLRGELEGIKGIVILHSKRFDHYATEIRNLKNDKRKPTYKKTP